MTDQSRVVDVNVCVYIHTCEVKEKGVDLQHLGYENVTLACQFIKTKTLSKSLGLLQTQKAFHYQIEPVGYHHRDRHYLQHPTT